MKKYIDRAALFNSLSNAKTVEEIFAAIQAAPAADVVEVLRCKDCQYAKPHDDDFWIKNNAPLLCEKYDWYVENDGYCSEGELKNEGARE